MTLIESDTLLNIYFDIYRRLTRLRQVEQLIAQKYSEQKMRCPVHLCVGQEGISAGLATALGKKGMLFGSHRSHGPYVASGGDLSAFFSELLGKADGCCGGRGGSMHLVALESGFWGAVPILGSTIAIATGAALAIQMQKKPQVSAVLFGDGSTEEGVFHESIQFAALKKLPVLYVCENNGFSVNTPLGERRPPQVKIAGLAAAHGLFTAQGDGNDPISVYNICLNAIERAMTGHGPSFLEFVTYRWLEHCGPNDDHSLPMRPVGEFERWKQHCPLKVMRRNLMEMGISSAVLDSLDEEEKLSMDVAWEQAAQASYPESSLAQKKVYASRVEVLHVSH